jgi:hypothetical protein
LSPVIVFERFTWFHEEVRHGGDLCGIQGTGLSRREVALEGLRAMEKGRPGTRDVTPGGVCCCRSASLRAYQTVRTG